MFSTRGESITRASASAYAAGAVAAGFIALTAWWLSVDNSVPYNDAAEHLSIAFEYHDMTRAGKLLDVLKEPCFYPPAVYLLGALGAFVGGVTVAAPILAQNLVYVPLLALACYQLGKLLEGPRAGLLAVVFALGAPLVIEQFHVFMLDLPQATLAAVTAWLVLASDRFARLGPAGLAGIALGVGIASKELVPLFVVGLVACVLARGGGWRNWRGLVVFIAAALLVGAPWYVLQVKLGYGALFLEGAGGGRDVPLAAHPPLLSIASLAWYFWATLNGLLLAPLFAFATVGIGAAVVRVMRTRRTDDFTLELLCGLGAAWLAVTVMPHHDLRYTLGFLAYLAVLGTVWIVRLAPFPRRMAISLLVAAIAVAHVGATLGVGGEATRRLPGNRNAAYGEGVPPRGRVIVYSNHDFMVGGPHGRPDVLALFEALRRDGMSSVEWEDRVERWDAEFEQIGLSVLARIGDLREIPESQRAPGLERGEASLIRARALGGAEPPCLRFADGTGIWVRVGVAGGQAPYCSRQS